MTFFESPPIRLPEHDAKPWPWLPELQATIRDLSERLAKTEAELNALKDALALTAVELAEVRKERDRAVERLERAGIL